MIRLRWVDELQLIFNFFKLFFLITFFKSIIFIIGLIEGHLSNYWIGFIYYHHLILYLFIGNYYLIRLRSLIIYLLFIIHYIIYLFLSYFFNFLSNLNFCGDVLLGIPLYLIILFIFFIFITVSFNFNALILIIIK